MKATLIERAYELAHSGTCPNTIAIAKQLKAESYEAVDRHFDSPSLRRTLQAICRQAGASSGAELPG